ncbi:hypothetical protein B0H16DRAFT_1695697 [Mycena metata]|uniref:Uncharacterized protein n=1 Tax=Mycena metata TaxID=1033252 RepID=A0AAD7MXK3_9AGAR|nr:hypothetical protein B0H16DRAFT_1695697 [Mycena metata]
MDWVKQPPFHSIHFKIQRMKFKARDPVKFLVIESSRVSVCFKLEITKGIRAHDDLAVQSTAIRFLAAHPRKEGGQAPPITAVVEVEVEDKEMTRNVDKASLQRIFILVTISHPVIRNNSMTDLKGKKYYLQHADGSEIYIYITLITEVGGAKPHTLVDYTSLGLSLSIFHFTRFSSLGLLNGHLWHWEMHFSFKLLEAVLNNTKMHGRGHLIHPLNQTTEQQYRFTDAGLFKTARRIFTSPLNSMFQFDHGSDVE